MENNTNSNTSESDKKNDEEVQNLTQSSQRSLSSEYSEPTTVSMSDEEERHANDIIFLKDSKKFENELKKEINQINEELNKSEATSFNFTTQGIFKSTNNNKNVISSGSGLPQQQQQQQQQQSSSATFSPIVPATAAAASSSSSKLPSSVTPTKWFGNNRNFLSPSPSGSINSYTSASTSKNTPNNKGSKNKGYSRRRQAKLLKNVEDNNCNFQDYKCTEPKASADSLFCESHLNETSASLLGKCHFINKKTGQKCEHLIFKDADTKNIYCEFHTKKIVAQRLKKKRRPKRDQNPNKKVLNSMKDTLETQKTSRETNGAIIQSINQWKNTQQRENALEDSYGSSEEEELKVEDYNKNQVENESDSDPGTGENIDLLKNSAYFSTEEVIKSYKAKLEQLRESYMTQFDFLKVTYKDKRKQSMNALEKYDEAEGQFTSDPSLIGSNEPNFIASEFQSKKNYNSLLNVYKNTGQRAVLNHQATKAAAEKKSTREEEKRIRKEFLKSSNSAVESDTDSDETCPIDIMDFSRANKSPSGAGPSNKQPEICSFSLNQDDKCKEKALPLTKYCQAHILNDPKQTLFVGCNFKNDDGELCGVPVLGIFDNGRCDFHKIVRIKEPPETDSEKRARISLESTLPVATNSNEEVQMLENLIAEELPDMKNFEEVLNYINETGLDKESTSESEEDEEAGRNEMDTKETDDYSNQMVDYACE